MKQKREYLCLQHSSKRILA